MDTANLVEFFCIFDEFCKYFDIELKKHGKRAVIETVNDELKNICQIDHTGHRSVNNFARRICWQA